MIADTNQPGLFSPTNILQPSEAVKRSRCCHLLEQLQNGPLNGRKLGRRLGSAGATTAAGLGAFRRHRDRDRPATATSLYAEPIIFLIILMVLFVRPYGLLGDFEAARR
ncbi:hypothetical protein DPM13_15610 [Paracoccus mutanolyticus]|uniref:Uncharacterized protein n=1 Tax=Paracoccus mutanolyticus TaxID=1499308 RepID=A0ABM6WT96_9RHOB|nr:hypothetical protein [Paracoccus mutanolyticus]AWX93926.1 hypothetical protein DPM13_15610 [Paracoccus mutanolyticus]